MNMVLSLTCHMYIYGCLTHKLRDFWGSEMYILRGTHPVASHEVVVKSIQHQKQVSNLAFGGRPLTGCIAHAFAL